MLVHVTEITMRPGSTMAFGRGITPKGAEVSFFGDWRPMRDIADAIASGETPVADVPDYMLA